MTVSTRSRTRRKSDRLAVPARRHDINFHEDEIDRSLSVCRHACRHQHRLGAAIHPARRIEVQSAIAATPAVAEDRSAGGAANGCAADKITTCLQEGAAGGLGPSDREEYSRVCANSR
jgi:hypothetical protein